MQSKASVRRANTSAGLVADHRRRFPRHEFVHPMVLLVGRHRHDGYTYDISQGGISFVLTDTVAAGPCTLELTGLQKSFMGRILEPLPALNGKTPRYRMEFAKPLETYTLKILLENHGSN